MVALDNHPGRFLNAEAAASLKRFEDDHGVQPLTDAGRLLSTQQDYIDRWDRGGPANRPPYLYEPRRPAELSDHVKNGGEAVDVTNWQYWRKHAGEYGWVVDYDWDVVHFRYDRNKDKHYNRAKKITGDIVAVNIGFEGRTYTISQGMVHCHADTATQLEAVAEYGPVQQKTEDNFKRAFQLNGFSPAIGAWSDKNWRNRLPQPGVTYVPAPGTVPNFGA